MLRSQVGDFIFWPFFFLNLICIESQVKDLSTKLFRRVGKKALVLPIGFWKFFSDTNRTTDRLTVNQKRTKALTIQRLTACYCECTGYFITI